MLNPLFLPAELTAAIRSVTNIERSLREHLEGQRGALAEMRRELSANRRNVETLPPKLDALHQEIAGLRADFQAVLAELTEVRETVEPLQGPAERVARLSERLPGKG
jgi:chromosome segregation ATPase